MTSAARLMRDALERLADLVWPLGYRYQSVSTYKSVEYVVDELPGRTAQVARQVFLATQQLARRLERHCSRPAAPAAVDDIPF